MTDPIDIYPNPIIPRTINMYIECGVEFIEVFSLKNTDLTGYRIYQQARPTFDSLAIQQLNCSTDNGKITIQVSTVLNQITNQNEPLTTISIRVPAQETYLLSEYTKLVYDIIFIPPSLQAFKMFEGKIFISPTATKIDESGVFQP